MPIETGGRIGQLGSRGGGGISVQFRIDGLQELEKALKDLRNEMTKRGEAGKEGKLVANALRFVARKNILPRMKALAPIGIKGAPWNKNDKDYKPGRLRRSIFYKPERNPRVLNEVFYVGPRAGKSRDDPNGAWYAAIVNFKGGAGGRGKGFMQRSIVPQTDVPVFAKNLGTGIERVAKRIGNKNLQEVGAKAKRRFS